jgi:guanylate kinase
MSTGKSYRGKQKTMSLVFVVSGPSGVGKGTLCKALLANYPHLGLRLSVSMTTRQPRPGEVEGEAYQFVTRDAFKHAIDQDHMLEWAEYNGQLYGTPQQAVQAMLDQGHPVLLEIELQGALQVRQAFGGQSRLLFVQPPSLAVLQQRLADRGTNTPADITNRLTIAQQEMNQAHLFDGQIVNDDLTQATQRMATWMQQQLIMAL